MWKKNVDSLFHKTIGLHCLECYIRILETKKKRSYKFEPKKLLTFFFRTGNHQEKPPNHHQVPVTPPTTTNKKSSCVKRWSIVVVVHKWSPWSLSVQSVGKGRSKNSVVLCAF